MPIKRSKPEQIVTMLRQIEVSIANGKTTPQACKESEITMQTFYRWRKEYGGLPRFSLGKIGSVFKFLFSQDYMWKLLRVTGSKKPDSPLRISYWSTTPVSIGPQAVKFQAKPDL